MHRELQLGRRIVRANIRRSHVHAGIFDAIHEEPHSIRRRAAFVGNGKRAKITRGADKI
jgi:hypothetical protein